MNNEHPIKTIRRSTDTLENLVESQERELRENSETILSANKMAEAYKTEIGKLRGSISVRDGLLRKRTALVEETVNQHQILRARIEELDGRIEERDIKIKDLTIDRTTLMNDVAMMKSGGLGAQIRQQTNEIVRLNKELSDWRERYNKLEAQNEHVKENNRQLVAANDRHMKTRDALRKRAEDALAVWIGRYKILYTAGKAGVGIGVSTPTLWMNEANTTDYTKVFENLIFAELNQIKERRPDTMEPGNPGNMVTPKTFYATDAEVEHAKIYEQLSQMARDHDQLKKENEELKRDYERVSEGIGRMWKDLKIPAGGLKI